MKKISIMVLFAVLPCISNAARYSNPYDLNKHTNKSTVSVDTKKTEKVHKDIQNRFYIGLHADISFLSWKSEYEDNGADVGSDSFKMKNVIGVGADFGYRLNDKWTAELELGYIGKYSEREKDLIARTDYDLSGTYLIINGLYDVRGGIYAGVGTGIAAVKAGVEDTALGKESKTGFSPMGALMLGYKYDMSENVGIDLRYRFSVFKGPKFGFDSVDVEVETGLITNHTVSVGMKYKF